MSEPILCTCYRFDGSPHDPSCPNNAAALVAIVKRLEADRDRLTAENAELRARCERAEALIREAAQCRAMIGTTHIWIGVTTEWIKAARAAGGEQ